MGGGATSRLYKGLVVDQGLAVSAGAFYDADMRDFATFGFYGSPKKGVPLADFESALETIVKSALKDGVTAAEVARAKERMQAEAIYCPRQPGRSGAHHRRGARHRAQPRGGREPARAPGGGNGG